MLMLYEFIIPEKLCNLFLANIQYPVNIVKEKNRM